MTEKFLLSTGSMHAFRVEIKGWNLVSMSYTTILDLNTSQEVNRLARFLQEVFNEPATARHYEDPRFPYILDYNPQYRQTEVVSITCSLTVGKTDYGDQSITMSRGTARKLLDALTGNHEKLVRDE